MLEGHHQIIAHLQQVHTLEKKIDGFEKRPIVVIHRRRMDAILTVCR
jgi:hypothetical protein